MPIYAYKCGACGKSHDALQKMSDAPLTICPHCNEPSLTKQVTAAGFQLKGSGWYVTDFRNNGQPAAKAAPGDSTGDKAAKDSGASGSEKGADKATGDKGGGESKSDSASPAPSPSPAPASAPPPATGTTPSQG